MVAGSLLAAASLALMASVPDFSSPNISNSGSSGSGRLVYGLSVYGLSWAGLGVAMRMILYDAAFTALARLGGREARGPIAAVTLLGGLASTALWPVGDALAEAFGWRVALLAYAGLARLTAPLHALIPDGRRAPPRPGRRPRSPGRPGTASSQRASTRPSSR